MPPFATMCSVANPAPPAPFALVGVTLEDGGGGDLIWVCQFNRPLNPATSNGQNAEFFLDGAPVVNVAGVVDGLDATKLRMTSTWEIDPFTEGQIIYNAMNESIQALDGTFAPSFDEVVPSPF